MGFGRSRSRAKIETPRSDAGVAPDEKKSYPIAYETRARNALKYYEETRQYEQQRDDRDYYHDQPTSDPGTHVEQRRHRQPQGWDRQARNDDEYYDDNNENDEPRATTFSHRKSQSKDSSASDASDANRRYVLQRSNSNVSLATSTYSNAALDGFVSSEDNNKSRRVKAVKIKKLFRRNKSGGGSSNDGKNNNNNNNIVKSDDALKDLAGAPYEIVARRKKKNKQRKGPSSPLTTQPQHRKPAGGQQQGNNYNDTTADAVNDRPEAAAARRQGRRQGKINNAPSPTGRTRGGCSPRNLNVITAPNPWADMNPSLGMNHPINVASPDSISTMHSQPWKGSSPSSRMNTAINVASPNSITWAPGTSPPSRINNAIDIASPNSITTEIYSKELKTYINPFLNRVPIDNRRPPTPLNLNGSYNFQGSGMPSVKWWTWKRPTDKQSYRTKGGNRKEEEETVFAFMCMFPQA